MTRNRYLPGVILVRSAWHHVCYLHLCIRPCVLALGARRGAARFLEMLSLVPSRYTLDWPRRINCPRTGRVSRGHAFTLIDVYYFLIPVSRSRQFRVSRRGGVRRGKLAPGVFAGQGKFHGLSR